MSPIAQPRSTPEEYLVRERKAQYRSEYLDGRVYAMAGASRAHNLVAGNVFAELRGKRCEAYVSDMRVRVSRTGLYTYPDVVAVRGEPRFEDAQGDHWMLTEISDPDASLELQSVECKVALHGVYERVELPAGGDRPLHP